MQSPPLDYAVEAAAILDTKIAALEQMSYQTALLHPESITEEAVISGTKVSISTFRQNYAHQLEADVLIVVQVATTRFLGATSHHIERGLVFSPKQAVRAASEVELQNSGG